MVFPTPPINPPNGQLQPVDRNLKWTTNGLQQQQQLFKSINGLTPTIACTASFLSNVYTLTPFNVSPQLGDYYDYWAFAFVAPADSTGTVTATVVPTVGTFPTLKVFKDNAQANAGDILNGVLYVLYYASSYDSNAGGFALK
jgi:hypothetical protein